MKTPLREVFTSQLKELTYTENKLALFLADNNTNYINWLENRVKAQEELLKEQKQLLIDSVDEIVHIKYHYKDKGHCEKYLVNVEKCLQKSIK